MRQRRSESAPEAMWSRLTGIALLAVGAVIGMASVVVVYLLGPMPWHAARNTELTATFDTYLLTRVLLIKPTGSGSYGVQAPTPGPLAAAAWDDDPGAYMIASILGPVTGMDSPYPGLMITQALLIAAAWLILPTAVARIFRSARAGFALLAVPPLLWLTNHGALFIGTAYGMSDEISTLPVYALYGITASLAFLSLTIIVLASSYTLDLKAVIAITVLIGVLAGFGNLFRSLSGFGVAVAIGVLWWLNSPRSKRWVVALVGAASAVLLAVVVQSTTMWSINSSRVEATGQTIQELPSAHTVWHSMYLGLSYPEPIGGGSSRFDVTWSDEFGWAQARTVDPDVIIASEEYDEILQGFFWEEVSANPLGATAQYVEKLGHVVVHFLPMLSVIVIGFLLALSTRTLRRSAAAATVTIAAPTAILGLAPPVLVMPMLYYYSELSASLGLLFCIAVAGIMVSLPIAVRTLRARRQRRSPAGTRT